MNQAPQAPSRSEYIVRSGVMMMHATTRGATKMRSGSASIARIASSCSVTAIVPSSAASAQPTRPATITAARTGPICLVTERLITLPSLDSCPNDANCSYPSSARIIPMKAPVIATTGMLAIPTA